MTTTSTRPASAPAEGPSPELPRLGGFGAVRFVWAQLTSMRTALILLFALALAAIPGSLVPQRKTTPVRVSEFITAHPRLGPLYDKIGMFAVYTSPWFSAIYLLLFISLVGCIIPRVRVYARALRARPPKTPRNLSRLPAYASGVLATAEGDRAVLDRAVELLRAARYRIDRFPNDATGGRVGSVAAERGYLREAGNLVFHVSLLFVLFGAAIGGLYGFRGTSVVLVGQGFSNNLTQYDDFSGGANFTDSDFVPFNVLVKSFDVKFETGPVQRGAARLFSADVAVTDRPGAAPKEEKLEVNKPLKINGTTVHLVGHGYAPIFTVKDGDGKVAFSGPVVMLPQDGNFTSISAIKVPDARPKRLAFEAFFYPTAAIDPVTGPTSRFPDAFNPAVFFNVWSGPPKVETGKPENVYSLDPTGLTQLRDESGAPRRYALTVGDGVTLPDKLGTIQFDGWQRWVKLQVGDAPGVPISIGAIGFAVAGLCLSLFIRPRRVWVAVRRSADGSAVLEIGGLDRADARAGLSDDVEDLARQLSGVDSSETEEIASSSTQPDAPEQATDTPPDKDGPTT